jgi:hypothetical protein
MFFTEIKNTSRFELINMFMLINSNYLLERERETIAIINHRPLLLFLLKQATGTDFFTKTYSANAGLRLSGGNVICIRVYPSCGIDVHGRIPFAVQCASLRERHVVERMTENIEWMIENLLTMATEPPFTRNYVELRIFIAKYAVYGYACHSVLLLQNTE